MVSRGFIKLIPSAATVAITTANIFFFVKQHFSEDFWYDYISVSNATLALIATLTMLYTALFCSRKLNLKRTYWGLSLAFGMYFIAEAIWAFSETILDEDLPYPSTADLFWILGTVILISELILYAYSIEMETSIIRLTIFYVVISTIIALLIKVAFWQVAIASFSEDYRPLQKSVDIFYFTGDCFIIYTIGLIILRRLQVKGWQDDLGWFLLLLGMIAMVVGDVFYTYTKLNEADVGYLIEDIMYSLQYFFWILGGSIFPMTLHTKRKKRKRSGGKN